MHFDKIVMDCSTNYYFLNIIIISLRQTFSLDMVLESMVDETFPPADIVLKPLKS